MAVPAQAVEFELPRNARQTAARDSVLDQVAVPIESYSSDGLKTYLAEGAVQRRAYRITTSGITPLQILAPLRSQVESAGFRILLDCNQAACGGYDFRFATEVLPAPNMIVNIRAFHYLTAQNETTGTYVTMLASSTDAVAYLQIIQIDPTSELALVTSPAPENAVSNQTEPGPEPDAAGSTDLIAELLENGSAVFQSLNFELGTTTLQNGPSLELEALAEFLAESPNLRIAIVGHTDSTGDRDANIAVSRARAAAVRGRLVDEFGANPAQIEEGGMGYLAPRASNLTPEGREANRRVEVILTGEDG